jgi:hypothetical protein
MLPEHNRAPRPAISRYASWMTVFQILQSRRLRLDGAGPYQSPE